MKMDAGQTLADAVAAYERGEMGTVLALLGPALGTSDDPRVAMLVGEAARHAGDDALLSHAADRLLAQDASAIRPLIWKGDVALRAQDQRRASQFYAAALARAGGKNVQPSLLAELQQVRAAQFKLQNRLAEFLDHYLSDHGMPEAKRSPRVQKSIRILSGRDEALMDLQQPLMHYVPDLPQVAWYDRAMFAWAAEMETQTDAIRAELVSVLQGANAFAPYIEGDTHGPVRNYQGLLNNSAWSAFYLWRDGAPVPENIVRCPITAAALARVPRPNFPTRAPTAMFSLLERRTHIPAHRGMLNARLIAHLPLIVPPDCAMRVGPETRAWQEGVLTIFDDSVEHEAWNKSDETRVVLLFDVARPELTAEEQQAIALCFAAVDAYQ